MANKYSDAELDYAMATNVKDKRRLAKKLASSNEVANHYTDAELEYAMTIDIKKKRSLAKKLGSARKYASVRMKRSPPNQKEIYLAAKKAKRASRVVRGLPL